jgi:hypothetical protein
MTPFLWMRKLPLGADVHIRVKSEKYKKLLLLKERVPLIQRKNPFQSRERLPQEELAHHHNPLVREDHKGRESGQTSLEMCTEIAILWIS